ncbi:protein kinase [Streptomyces sp. PSKA30]|uniref:protein kinase domain-containing protein n=1 Tax=Streptomyces sp. PSKA30 TaxID=2874597 RepID=UPI001CD0CE98|nr:protein kinase [Streptomyces sp. PSKA30]MBZ9641365.1 serine/threonine-protein kinase [Streptomyces sp. PSKA30]
MPTSLTHDDPAALGPYRLIARLGSGGMGTVYVARSAGGRTVALKTMHAGIATDPAARTRFRLEVDAARVIGGQFGARVMDADPLAETPWLATEYVLGPALDEAIEACGPLPERSVRALGAALCSALGQLHRSDIVHRDLKPSNILITAYGPKVIDFGIARAIGDDRLTRTGAAVGTPAFMSPEQATGQDHDAAGDVFALAGVLVYAATGHGPFGYGQAADLLYRVRYGEADLSGVPDSLVPLLARCLSKDPLQRPGIAELAAHLHDGQGEFAEQLPESLLAEIGRRAVDVWQIVPQRLPAPPDNPGPVPVAAGPGSRPSRRGFLAMGGLLAASAAVGGGVWWRQGRTSPDAPPQGGGSTATGSNAEKTRNLDPLWQYGMGFNSSSIWALTVPHVVDGTVLVPTGGNTEGVGPTDGEAKWQATTWETGWQMVVADGRVYRLSRTGITDDGIGSPVALETANPRDGETIKTLARFAGTNDQLEAQQLLCVFDGVAYAAVGEGKTSPLGLFLTTHSFTLRAVDIRTGEILWSKPLPKRPYKSERLHFLAAKAVGSRLVTLQEVEEWKVRVVVRDTRTGAVVWDKPYDVLNPEPLRSAIAADDSHLYLGGARLRALRVRDGEEVWATEAGGRYSPPTLKTGVVYAVREGAGLTTVDADEGEVLWTEQGGEVDEASTGWRPIVGTRYAYYKNGALLRALSLSNHRTALTYKTDGEQFYEDAQTKLLLAVDNDYVTAYPLR